MLLLLFVDVNLLWTILCEVIEHLGVGIY
jgi:hypothetical protein